MNLCKYILMIIVLLVPTSAAVAEDFSRCDDCHGRTLERDRGRIYQHQPFAQQECRSCHSVPVEVVTQPVPGRSGSPTGLDRRRIAWLEESAVATIEHAFLFPADKLGELLVVEARDQDGGFTRTELSIPRLAEVEEVADQGQAPRISDLQILEVRRGVFLSVTIGWRTDTLTDARVFYGLKDPTQVAGSGRRYGVQHQVVLNQVQPGKTYNFRAVSRDLFGRDHESETLTFSTARAVPGAPQVSTSRAKGGPSLVASSVRRRGSNYLFDLRLENPATLFVGSKGEVREQQAEPPPIATAEAGTDVHAGLSTGAVLTIDSCRSCHSKQNAATHPVNVFPKPGMVIPPEYPTLPDGRISCISCHAIHGSNNEYLARKPGKRDLCVGCHQDML